MREVVGLPGLRVLLLAQVRLKKEPRISDRHTYDLMIRANLHVQRKSWKDILSFEAHVGTGHGGSLCSQGKRGRRGGRLPVIGEVDVRLGHWLP